MLGTGLLCLLLIDLGDSKMTLLLELLFVDVGGVISATEDGLALPHELDADCKVLSERR